MTPTILEAAAVEIERCGHNKRWFWRNPTGGDRDEARRNGPCCVVGAIRRVVGELDYWGPRTDEALAYVYRALSGTGILGSHKTLTTWNDAPERTATEVIAALRAAAREGSK